MNNKLDRSHYCYLFVLSTIHLFLLAIPPWALATEHTLIFKKALSEQTAQIRKYEVEKGDSIYSILKSFHQETQEIPALLEKVKRLNPGIRNINKIYPGQTIRLPGKVIQDSAQDYHPSTAEKYKRKQYTVKPGDCLIKILKKEAHISKKLIFNEYLNLFQRLNPDISELNKIRSGQRITLPVPVKKTTKKISLQKTPIAQDEPRSNSKKVSRPPENIFSKQNSSPNKYMALCMLREMGFEFAEHKKIFLPSNSIEWHQLDTIQTPILTSPWGEKFLLLDSSSYPGSLKKRHQKNCLNICNIKSSWKLRALFEEIEKNSNRKLVYWDAQETLILNLDNHALEIRGNHLFVLNISPRRYYFFIKSDPNNIKISSLLSGYLAKQNIYLYSFNKKHKKLTRINTPGYPKKDNLHTPQKSRSEILSELSDSTSQKRIQLLKNKKNGFVPKLGERLNDFSTSKDKHYITSNI